MPFLAKKKFAEPLRKILSLPRVSQRDNSVVRTLCVPLHRMRRAGGPQMAAPHLPSYFHLPESMSPVRLGSQAGRPPVSLAREGTILGIFMMEQYFFGKQMESC